MAKECVPFEYDMQDKYNILGSEFQLDHKNNLVKMWHYNSVSEALNMYGLGV